MGKFEDSWKGVFENAEATPSDSVWSGIDQAMEGGELKKRLFFYQRLAAAAVLFALVLGGYEVYHLKTGDRLADHFKTSVPEKEQLNASEQQIANNSKTEHANQQAEAGNKVGDQNFKTDLTQKEQSIKSSKQLAANSKNDLAKQFESKKLTIEKTSSSEKSVIENLQRENQVALLSEKQPDFNLTENENNLQKQFYFQREHSYANLDGDQPLPLLPGAELKGEPREVELVRRLPAIPAAFMADNKKKNSLNENVWAAFTASSGSYNANMPNTAFATNSASIGTSYSMSMLAGKRVAKRWALQSGVQYLNQSMTGTSYSSSSNSMAVLATSIYTHPAVGSNGAIPVNLLSANEFVSVPVQIGYLIVDRKFGWQINPGLATDFFIRNTLSDQSGQRQSYSQSAGDNSPYRSVNFSGLMSTEFSYKMSNHYRISLVPGLRYSFNPMLKSAVSNSSGNPMLWDLGFRFKYIFK